MKLKIKIGFFALVFVFLASPVFAELFSGSSVGPTASFFASPTTAITGNTVVFDASASRDSRGSLSGLKFRWDFEGNYGWSSWSSSSQATYVFTDPKNYKTRLQVKDVDGLVDETVFAMTISTKFESSKPFAEISVDPESGDTSTNFHFTVDVFSNIHTPTDQLKVRWDWDHDGVWDSSWSLAREFFHVFPEALNQEVWLEVKDIDGSTSIEKGIYVEGKENDTIRNKEMGLISISKVTAPIASFETSAAAIDQNTLVHFDASASIRAAEYRWDFDGNGRFDNSWSSDNKKVQYFYRDIGVFGATLEVRNSAGETDTTIRTISVSDNSNILPTASFIMRNRTNILLGSQLAILQDEVRFTANVKDEDGLGSKSEVRWDFDGDGAFDTTFSTIKTAIYQFVSTGDKSPRLQVRDELGGLAMVSGQIQIVANTAPRPSLKISPSAGAPGSTFRFDASASEDDQTGTSNLEYRFDFDGDGLFDTEFKKVRSYSQKIGRVGSLTAVVEVRDQANATSRETAIFSVVVPAEPIAGFVVEPRVGTFATSFEFNVSASSDPSSLDKSLSYRWDFDYRGENDINFSTGWISSPTYRYKFSEVGDHSVRLVVRSSDGLQDEVFGKIKVHEESLSLQYLRQKGIITDEQNPNKLITRAELAKIIVKATRILAPTPRNQQFTDVPINSADARYISAVAARSWISPRNNFAWQPEGSVNRAEASKVVISALYPRVATTNSFSFTDVPESAWFARFVETAAAQNLFKTEGNKFDPAAPVTRAEFARMVAVLLDRYSGQFHASVPSPTAREFFTKIIASITFAD